MKLDVNELEARALPAAPGLVAVGSQPDGGLSGKIAYLHAGHGHTAANEGSGAWSFQRGITNGMIEDLGNIDQMNFLAEYLFRAGATVVPLRPIGHQVNEVVLDNDSGGVTFSGSWTNSSSGIFYGSPGDVPYKFAPTSLTETAYARYQPNISAAGFYPVYSWVTSGANRPADQLYRVNHAGGITEVTVNHRRVGNGLVYLGTYYFNAGTGGHVDISNRSSAAGSQVIADMIRFGNGMGSITRGGGVSGRPREDEAGLYWIQWHVERSQGIATTEYRTSSNDNTATVGASPRYAEYMNNQSDGALKDRVFVSYHSNAGGGSARGVIALYNGNNSSTSVTPNQFTLANTLGLEINNDLVARNGEFEHNWFNRGTNVTLDDGAIEYGEINNSVINNEFDATIVETAFHDNVLDAQLMRDARVRDAVARATYQGLIKYFRAVDGNTTPSTVLPGAVTSLRAVSGTAGSVTLTWTAPVSSGALGGTASGYRIFASTNGFAFDGGTVVTSTTATLSGYDAATPYYFRVVAVNDGGESEPSEVVAVLPAGGPKQVLIVNGFDRLERTQNPTEAAGGGTIERVRPRQSNSRDYTVQVGAAISASRPGLRFESSSNEAVISGAVNLNNYDAVIWILGEESTGTKTFDATEQAKVEQFIAGGGHLFLSGSEIGWDLDFQANGVAFYESTLKANYINDDAGSYNLSGTAGGIFNGLSFAFDNGAQFYNADFPDVINPQVGATAALTYSTGGNAAVQALGSGGRGRVVMLGFPFETITTAANRAAVLGRVFTFFNMIPDTIAPVVSASSMAANGVYSTGQTIPITLTFSELVILVGGNLNITLDTGAVLSVTPFTGTSVTATYTIAAGQTSPDLNVSLLSLAAGATLKDLAGNAAILALPTNNLAALKTFIINPLAPTTVSAVTVNLGAAQRSRVTAIRLDFAMPVNAVQLARPGVVVLTRSDGATVSTGAMGATGRISIAPLSSSTTSVTLTFDVADGSMVNNSVEYGSLADGVWQLSIPYLNTTSLPIRRLFGDFNGDGTVDGGGDFAEFGVAFGQSLANSPFDWNADGTIDGGTDFAQFGTRFGTSL